MRSESGRLLVVKAAFVLAFVPGLAAAQSGVGFDRLLPHVRYFPSLIADPLEPRLAVGLLQTNIFRADGAPIGRERDGPLFIDDPEDSRSDVDAITAIGGTLPWWHLARWSDSTGIVIAAQAGVMGRFRIEYPTRTDVGQDYFVGMPIEIAHGRWSGRLRFMHRSSHLGDELIESTGARRVEVGGEFVDAMAAFKLAPHTRVYGGTAWIFRSYTENTRVLFDQGRGDKTLVQLGAESGYFPWLNGRLGWVGAVDWRSAQRTDWQSSLAAAGGLTVKTNTRVARLLVRYFTGASLMEQFFLTPEKYWSIELVTDF